jgi:hydroxyethylthiazole kinase
MIETIRALITKIKKEKPLVLNLTNDVTMDFIANGLLSLGALPIMSKATQEMEDLLQLVKAVVINLGTLNASFIGLCTQACQIANQYNVPIILDPVGAGASRYRTETALQFIRDYSIAIIRGNASEVMALAGAAGGTQGVDSTMESTQAIASAQNLAKNYCTTIAISGKIDVVVDEKEIAKFERGSPLMPLITGTGCLLSAVVGAFHAVEKNRFTAASAAILYYGMCGEMAAADVAGPGSFRVAFLDTLHKILL